MAPDGESATAVDPLVAGDGSGVGAGKEEEGIDDRKEGEAAMKEGEAGMKEGEAAMKEGDAPMEEGNIAKMMKAACKAPIASAVRLLCCHAVRHSG